MSNIENPMRFALAGRAVFTLVSAKTEKRFTYRVNRPSDEEGSRGQASTMHFVSVLTGPNNQTDWKYLGFMRRGVYFHGGQKAKVGAEAPSAVAFKWWWENVARGVSMPSLELHHEGKCGRCGRALTVPESIQSGFGPECIGRV